MTTMIRDSSLSLIEFRDESARLIQTFVRSSIVKAGHATIFISVQPVLPSVSMRILRGSSSDKPAYHSIEALDKYLGDSVNRRPALRRIHVYSCKQSQVNDEIDGSPSPLSSARYKSRDGIKREISRDFSTPVHVKCTTNPLAAICSKMCRYTER